MWPFDLGRRRRERAAEAARRQRVTDLQITFTRNIADLNAYTERVEQRMAELNRIHQQRGWETPNRARAAAGVAPAPAAVGGLITPDVARWENYYVDATTFGDIRTTYLTHTWADPTPEQFAAARRAAEAREEKERERKEAWAKAEKVAHALLLTHLTPGQAKTYQDERKRYIDVKGANLTYRIYSSGAVQVVAPASRVGGFCVYPAKVIPSGDKVLAAKLLIEGNEEAFLKTANYSGQGISLGKIDTTGKIVSTRYDRTIQGIDI